MDNIDKIVKILLWMLRKYKDDLEKEFSEYIQDSPNEYHTLNIIMDIIYDEINKEMPKPWYEYGFGLSEK